MFLGGFLSKSRCEIGVRKEYILNLFEMFPGGFRSKSRCEIGVRKECLTFPSIFTPFLRCCLEDSIPSRGEIDVGTEYLTITMLYEMLTRLSNFMSRCEVGVRKEYLGQPQNLV